MNISNRFLPEKPHRDSKYDFSPFKVRLDPQRHSTDSHAKKTQRTRVKIVDPQEETPHSSRPPTSAGHEPPTKSIEKPSILRETAQGRSSRATTPVEDKAVKLADKNQMHLWTLNQFHTQSLHPSVSEKESREYDRYVSHPLNLPLVVSTKLPSDANVDYIEYIHRARGQDMDEEETFASGISEQDLQHFWDFVEERQDPLTVMEEDGTKKRYKAYRQWLRGKSLFKQSKVDPEYKAGA